MLPVAVADEPRGSKKHALTDAKLGPLLRDDCLVPDKHWLRAVIPFVSGCKKPFVVASLQTVAVPDTHELYIWLEQIVAIPKVPVSGQFGLHHVCLPGFVSPWADRNESACLALK